MKIPMNIIEQFRGSLRNYQEVAAILLRDGVPDALQGPLVDMEAAAFAELQAAHGEIQRAGRG